MKTGLPAAALLAAGASFATDVSVVGVMGNKAVLVIDGGAPRTLSVGRTSPEGVKLLAVDGDGATVEALGKRLRLRMGEGGVVTSATDARGAPSVTLIADVQGHFHTDGAVNGAAVRFVVDTGATLVALGAADASRLGIDIRKGQPGMTMTANGPSQAWRVRLDTVRVGEIVLRDVEGVVLPSNLPVALLGMSFLNRMEMKREGESMTLRQRY